MILPRKRYDEKYFPKYKATTEFFAWHNMFFEEENKTAKAHFQIQDHIFSKYRHKVIECTRGLAKSTLARRNTLFWLFKGNKHNFGRVNFILYIQDTLAMVKATFENILYDIENTELRNFIEIERKLLGDDPTLYLVNKEKGNKMIMKGRGSEQSLRGVNVLNKRPEVVVLDDIENEEKHLSKEGREKLKRWFFNVVLPAINARRHEFILIGTPIHEDSLLMNLINTNQWKAIQLPACEEYPSDNIISCWDDRFTKEYIDTQYGLYEETGRISSFFQEYMLEVVPAEGRLFNLSNINYFKMKEFDFNRLTYYISVDLAVSEKEYADYTAIAVIGVGENNHWFLVDGFFGRIKPDETIDRIFYYVSKWSPNSVILEKVAFQLSMKTFIQNEMIKRGRFFNLEMVARNKSKLAVIKALQPLIELGMFWIPEDYIKGFRDELLHEMELITNDAILAKHDDLIDCVAQLTLIDVVCAIPQRTIDEDVEVKVANSYLI